MEIPNNNVIDGNNVTCFGASDGKVVATAVGGQSPYTFTWSGPLGISFQTGISTINPGTDTAYNLIAGDYTVILQDGNSCQGFDTVEVIQPDSIPIFAGTDTPKPCMILTAVGE